jgi:short-subunit dehydrogenase
MEEIKNEKCLAVVTGASSGIGYELAKVFANNGFDLLIAAEDAGIESAAREIGTQTGRRVDFLRVDLARKEGVDALYRRIVESGQPVEALVVNAGVGVSGEFAETLIEEEINLINLNVISSVRLSKMILKDMLNQGRGRILFTSSVAAEMPGPYYAVYAASKAFVQSFASAIRFEVKDKGIVITALQPGATDTNFFERAHMTDTKVGQAEKDDAAEVAQQGFDALMAGKDHVVAGSLMNKVNVAGARFMTEQQGARMQAQQTKPQDTH